MLPFLLRPNSAVADVGGGGGIRTPVGLHPNGFQDRLVMTASIRLHIQLNTVSLYQGAGNVSIIFENNKSVYIVMCVYIDYPTQKRVAALSSNSFCSKHIVNDIL